MMEDELRIMEDNLEIYGIHHIVFPNQSHHIFSDSGSVQSWPHQIFNLADLLDVW
jgi:hypothetical protein